MKSNRRGFLKFLSTAPVAAEVVTEKPLEFTLKAHPHATYSVLPDRLPVIPPAPEVPQDVKVGLHELSASGFCYTCGCCKSPGDGVHVGWPVLSATDMNVFMFGNSGPVKVVSIRKDVR